MNSYLKRVGIKASVPSPGGRCIVLVMQFYDPESASPEFKLKAVFKQEVHCSFLQSILNIPEQWWLVGRTLTESQLFSVGFLSSPDFLSPEADAHTRQSTVS